jgi:hypothetical protein
MPGDGAVDLEVAEQLDAVALTVKPLAVADRLGAVGFRRDDGANAALLEVVAETRTPSARSGKSISAS